MQRWTVEETPSGMGTCKTFTMDQGKSLILKMQVEEHSGTVILYPPP